MNDVVRTSVFYRSSLHRRSTSSAVTTVSGVSLSSEHKDIPFKGVGAGLSTSEGTPPLSSVGGYSLAVSVSLSQAPLPHQASASAPSDIQSSISKRRRKEGLSSRGVIRVLGVVALTLIAATLWWNNLFGLRRYQPLVPANTQQAIENKRAEIAREMLIKREDPLFRQTLHTNLEQNMSVDLISPRSFCASQISPVELGYVKVPGLTDPLTVAGLIYDEMARLNEERVVELAEKTCFNHASISYQHTDLIKLNSNDRIQTTEPPANAASSNLYPPRNKAVLGHPLSDIEAFIENVPESDKRQLLSANRKLVLDIVYTYVTPAASSFRESISQRKVQVERRKAREHAAKRRTLLKEGGPKLVKDNWWTRPRTQTLTLADKERAIDRAAFSTLWANAADFFHPKNMQRLNCSSLFTCSEDISLTHGPNASITTLLRHRLNRASDELVSLQETLLEMIADGKNPATFAVKSVKDEGVAVDEGVADPQRYRDWDEILYSLRGNYYNLMGGPRWDIDAAGSERKGADGEALGNRPSTVRNIYIVLADKDQAPAWLRFRGDSATTAPPSALEREFIDRIVLVEHRELVPLHLQASVLPTFNSYVIESLLHRIPGLSRHYIYFNNDMLLARPVSFFDYFQPYVVYPGRDAANANAVPEVRWLPLIMVDRLQKVRCTKSRDRCTFYRDPLYTNHLAWMRQAFDWDAVIKNRPQLSFEKRTPTMPFLYYSHFPHLIDRHIMGRLMEGSQYDPKTCVGTSPHLNITKEKGVALKGVDFFADKVRAMHLDAEEKGLGFRNVEGDVFPVLVYNHYQLILRHGGDMTAVGRVLEGVGTYNSAAFGDFAKGKLSDPRFPPCNPAEGGAMPDSGLEVRTHNEHANVQRYPVGDPTGDETAFFDCYGRERRTLLSHLALLSQTFRGSQLKGSGSEKDERISGLSSTFAYPHKLVARSSVLKNSDESPERVLIREFWEIATIIANSTLSSKIPIRFFKVNRELTNHSVSVPISSYFLKEKRKVADTCRANETQFVTDTVGLEPRFSAVSLHLDKKCRSSHVVASLVPKQVMEIQNVTLATPLLVLPLYRARAYRTNGHRGSYDHWLHDWAGSVSGTPLTLASSVRCYFGMMTHIPPPTYKNGTTAAPKPRQTTYGDVMPRRGRVLFLTINDDLVAKGSQNIIPGIGTMRKLLGFVPPKPLVQTSVPKVEPSPSHLLYVALGGSSSNIRESTQILGEASPGNPSNLSVRELLTDYFLSGDLSKTRVPDERDSVLTSVWSVRGLANLFTDPAFDFASQPRSKQWQIENQVPPSHAKLVGDATRGSVRRRLRMFSAIAFLESEAEKTRAAIGALEVHVSVAPTTTPNVSPVEASGGEMLTLIYQEFAPPYPAPWERSKTGRRKRRV